MRSKEGSRLVIRESQMRAFEEAGARGFEDRMVERLRSNFPNHEKNLGENQLRVMVRLAVDRARNHWLTTERSIALYLDLMCVLGSGFDDDPQYPWAAALLADRSFPTQDERIDLLHSRGWEFAKKVGADFESFLANPDGSRMMAGFNKIGHMSVAVLTPATAPRTAHEIFVQLREMFPVKSAAIGDECIHLLVQHAFETAASYGIRSARGVCLFAVLMFLVGAGFDNDPQLPWAFRTLSDDSIPDPVTRVERLYAEGRAALKDWSGIGLGERA